MIRNTEASIPLCNELEAWCHAQKLPLLRADDLALRPYLTVAQKTWLAEFRSRWALLKVKDEPQGDGAEHTPKRIAVDMSRARASMPKGHDGQLTPEGIRFTRLLEQIVDSTEQRPFVTEEHENYIEIASSYYGDGMKTLRLPKTVIQLQQITPLDQYFLCVKSGKKWVAVAGVNLGPNSCVARASHAFADAGYETWQNKVCWAAPMSIHGNYGGKSLNYKTLPAPIETVV